MTKYENINILNSRTANISILHINDRLCVIAVKSNCDDPLDNLYNYLVSEKRDNIDSVISRHNKDGITPTIKKNNFFEKKQCDAYNNHSFVYGATFLYLCEKTGTRVAPCVQMFDTHYKIIDKKMLVGIDARLVLLNDGKFMIYIYHSLPSCGNNKSSRDVNGMISSLFFAQIIEKRITIFDVRPLFIEYDCNTKNLLFYYDNATNMLKCIDVYLHKEFVINLDIILHANGDKYGLLNSVVDDKKLENMINMHLLPIKIFYLKNKYYHLQLQYYTNVNTNFRHIYVLDKPRDPMEGKDITLSRDIDLGIPKKIFSGSSLNGNIGLVHFKLLLFSQENFEKKLSALLESPGIDLHRLSRMLLDLGSHNGSLDVFGECFSPTENMYVKQLCKTTIDSLDKYISDDDVEKYAVRIKHDMNDETELIVYQHMMSLLAYVCYIKVQHAAGKMEKVYFMKDKSIQEKIDFSHCDEIYLLLLLMIESYFYTAHAIQFNHVGKIFHDMINKNIFIKTHSSSIISSYANCFIKYNHLNNKIEQLSDPFIIDDCALSGVSFITHIGDYDDTHMYFTCGIDDSLSRQYIVSKKMVNDLINTNWKHTEVIETKLKILNNGVFNSLPKIADMSELDNTIIIGLITFFSKKTIPIDLKPIFDKIVDIYLKPLNLLLLSLGFVSFREESIKLHRLLVQDVNKLMKDFKEKICGI